MIAAVHRDWFAALLGEAGLAEGLAMAPYEQGARTDRGRAALVVRPTTTGEVSRMLAYCAKQGLPVVPQSGNSGVVSGSTPDATGQQIVLSLDRLVQRFDVDCANRSLSADAGFRLSETNRRLAAHGLFFPVDLGSDPLLGGMIATNTGGARFLRYGDVRRNILGATVVMADEAGTVLDLNRALRKNNTGVDWKQLFVGTCGAFGVITECTLNLERLPQQVATAYLLPKCFKAVMPLLELMEERFGSYLSAFEGMSANAISATLAHVPSMRNPFAGGVIPDYVILIELSRTWPLRPGEQSLDDVLLETLATCMEENRDLIRDVLPGPSAEMWRLRHALSEGVRKSGHLIAFDLAFTRGAMIAFRDRIVAELPASFPELVLADFGHVGDGGMHFNLVLPSEWKFGADQEKKIRDWIISICVEEYGGSYSGEHGIGRKNISYYNRYSTLKIKHLSRQMKAITSPGLIGAVSFDGQLYLFDCESQ